MAEFDAIVIGAGEAGALTANLALDAGLRVAMVYRAPYGSTCLNVGCVPSKFLIHRARLAHLARTMSRFGIETSAPRVDLARIVGEKDRLIEEDRAESLAAARAASGLSLFEGEARFIDARTVRVGGQRLRADRLFIATGLRPDVPGIEGLADVPYLTSESLMNETSVPGHLIVLGGGYVACELGQAYARFGARVTIVQSHEHLLPDEEPDVSTVLERAFRSESIELLLGHRAARVEHTAHGVRVSVRATDGDERTIEGAHLLVATGRRPNTDGLALELAGVETDERGFVKVNDRLETSIPGIWAIGDVNGEQPFTRVCQEEAKIAVANAFSGTALRIDRRSLGHAVFTDPEVGSVGLTEAQARAKGYEIERGLVTFDQVEKAALIGETAGFIKYVIERSSRRVLGCHVIGSFAADLVHEAAIVMHHDGLIDELATAVGIFPTLAEGMEGSARALLRRIAPRAVPSALAAITAVPEATSTKGGT